MNSFAKGVISTLPPYLLGMTLGYLLANKAPSTLGAENMEPGYVNPSGLEIKVDDLNNNGQRELQLRYEGKSYMLKLDVKGQPFVQAYELKSAQIVPK